MKLRIKELREELQMTQKELAGRVSSAQRNVSNWENGLAEPDLETVVKLQGVFGVTLEELFGLTAAEDLPVSGNPERALLRRIRALTPIQRAALLNFLNTLCPAE